MRCAVYVRVSTDKEEQKSSLENQQQLFLNYIAQREGWILTEFYIDVQSGTTEKRENFLRMIEDAELRKFDCILAKELSRLARNGELAYKIRRTLDSSKIHLITLDGAINTLEGNRDKFGLFAWLYEEESQRTSVRIKAALKQKASKGEFKGSRPPYGYRVENKQLVPRDDDTVEGVRLIYRLYLEGKGVEAIAKELDRKGFPTPGQVTGFRNAGRYWQGSSVTEILSNPHYVGDLVQGRTEVRSVTEKTRDDVPKSQWAIVENTHVGLISRHDFDAVQSMRKSRYAPRPKAKKHLFTNYLFCADCGKSLWYLQNRKGYVCGTFKKHGDTKCSSHSIKEKDLKRIILKDLRSMAKMVLDKDSFIEQMEQSANQGRREQERKLQNLRKKTDALQGENKKFLKLLAGEVISQEEYREAVDENHREIERIRAQIVRLESELFQHSQGTDLAKRMMAELDEVMKFPDLTEALLHRLIEKIEVNAHGKPVIYYRFADPFTVKA
jgi:site-specific DNA recombinase